MRSFANDSYASGATHTKIKYKDWFNDLNTKEMKMNNLHPKIKEPDVKYDLWLSKAVFRVNKVYLKKKISNNKLYKYLKLIKKNFSK